MIGLVAASVVAMPLLAADEKSFFHIPGVHDFRSQKIYRTDREDAWPFTVDEGVLTCAYVMGKQAVYFVEMKRDEKEPRVMILATDPAGLMTGAAMGKGLLPPTNTIDGMAKLMRLLGPFEALGKRLCDQPAGSHLGSGEL